MFVLNFKREASKASAYKRKPETLLYQIIWQVQPYNFLIGINYVRRKIAGRGKPANLDQEILSCNFQLKMSNIPLNKILSRKIDKKTVNKIIFLEFSEKIYGQPQLMMLLLTIRIITHQRNFSGVQIFIYNF